MADPEAAACEVNERYDIPADKAGYQAICAAAHRDLYLNWDDVVRDVYEDYRRMCGKGLGEK